MSEAPSVVTSILLLAKSSLRSRAAWVAILIGLFISLVLSTFSKPKLVFAPKTVIAFVPPFSIGTTPVTFSALFAAKAKGTVSNFWLLISTKSPHSPETSRATFRLLTSTLQNILANDEAYPPVWLPVPITKFTIPNSSVVVVIVSWYSVKERLSTIENCKHTFLFGIGALVLFTPGITSPLGL